MVSRQGVLTKIFGDPQTKLLKVLQKKVILVNQLSDKYAKMSDAELKNQTTVLKKPTAKKGSDA